MDSAKNRARARALKELLEANARWNQTKRDTSANDLRRTVDETSTINPELRKEMLYSWECGFIEDKPEDSVSQNQWSPILLRKDDGRKSGKVLTKPLKGKVTSETPSTVKTAAGAIYRKNDIAKANVNVQNQANHRRSPTGEEPKKKQQKKSQRKSGEQEENEDNWSEDELLSQQLILDPEEARNKFQDSPTVVPSKDTMQGGGLILAVKRVKPNNAVTFTKPTKIKWGGGSNAKTQPIQKTARSKSAAAAAAEENQPSPVCSSRSAVVPPSTSTPQNNTTAKPKEISRHSSPETILETLNRKDLTPAGWNRMADQVLERGVQGAAEEIPKPKDATGEDEDSNNPPGFSDESEEGETSVRRSGRSKKGPSRYGDPIKHSVKLISSQMIFWI